MIGEIKRLEMVARNMHVDAPRMREDVRVALGLLEQADAVMSEMDDDSLPCPCCGGEHHTPKCALNNWRERYKEAKGE
jgi:hypothetical protein